jgi:hypothetical protein
MDARWPEWLEKEWENERLDRAWSTLENSPILRNLAVEDDAAKAYWFSAALMGMSERDGR